VRDHLRFKDVDKMRESTLKRFLRGENFRHHLDLHWIDCMGSHQDMSAFEFCSSKLEEFEKADIEQSLRPKPLLTGNDLIVGGYSPGPVFKQILTSVEDAQLEGKIASREEALAYVRKEFPVE